MPSNLFSAGQIGTMTLPNRVIRSATQDPFGHRDGTCAPEQVALYRDIAAAGTGAIITAYSYISPEARSTGIQVGFATEEQRASQKEVLDAVHEAGGRLILGTNSTDGAFDLLWDDKKVVHKSKTDLFTLYDANGMTVDAMDNGL